MFTTLTLTLAWERCGYQCYWASLEVFQVKVEPVAVEACEGQKQVVQQGFGALVWDLMLNEMKENLVAMIQARMVMCAKTFRYAQSENKYLQR